MVKGCSQRILQNIRLNTSLDVIIVMERGEISSELKRKEDLEVKYYYLLLKQKHLLVNGKK